MTSSTKTCSKCAVEKNITDFSARKARDGGTRYVSACKACANAISNAAYYRNREERLEAAKKWAKTKKGQEIQKRSVLKFNYGLTLEEYNRLLAVQGCKCAICRTDQPGGRWNRNFFVDHDHTTGRVRALLCHNCNAGVGHFKDDPSLMRLAATYVEYHHHKDDEDMGD